MFFHLVGKQNYLHYKKAWKDILKKMKINFMTVTSGKRRYA
jgi:hypothetical protein